MTKQELIETAAKLEKIPSGAADEYAEKREVMAAELNRRMRERQDLADLIGEHNQDMMADNHINHARFIASILRRYNPEVLVETILWVFRSYRSRGFHQNYWAAQLNAWTDVMQQELSAEAFAAVYPLYDWMITHIPAFSTISDMQLSEMKQSRSRPPH